ncbi:MAG TPA: PrsW family intramembrane metalloprotease [Pyrinomonadaceae bacterium]|nr:PrsW family intramembrane metalloprotease [Pyrinomonadaceae bacterium]
MNEFAGIPHTPLQAAPVAAALPARPRRSLLRWAGIVAVALVALLLALLLLLMTGLETGPVPLLIGFVLATLPVPLYVALVLWIDRYESEPVWTLVTAFAWGAIGAVFIAAFVNTLGSLVVASLVSDEAGNFFGAVVSAPIVEESMKAAVLFGLYFWKQDEFDGVIDGIVYASMVGLGFAMTENIQYYGSAALQGGVGGGLALFILRGMMAPFSHPLFTSMTGIGLGLATQTKNGFVKFLAPVLGLMLAMILHSLWNLSASINAALYFIVYFLIMVPMFVAVLVSIYFALKREGRIVREHLRYDLEHGRLTPAELELLASIRGRMGASFRALQKGGYRSWRTRREFNRVASELAFHRNRIAQGALVKDGAAVEELYVRQLTELRGQSGIS